LEDRPLYACVLNPRLDSKLIFFTAGLTGFAIFITVVDLVLALFILAVPVIYDKYNKFNRLARAMKEDRVQFILIGVGAITTLLIRSVLICMTGLVRILTYLFSFIVTISAWTEPGCKKADDDPNAKLGDDFKNGLSGWCSTKKAGAVFLWLAFGMATRFLDLDLKTDRCIYIAAWIASTVLAFLDWRSGKARRRARDPPFTHPEDPSGYAPSVRSAARPINEYEEEDDEDEEPFSYPSGHQQPTSSHVPQIPPFRGNSGGMGMDQSPFGDEYRSSAPGGGVGGFQPPPAAAAAAGPGVSRTMQYADPYAAIKANLVSGTAGHNEPNDYSYTGYR
jgi:hypothetical protein